MRTPRRATSLFALTLVGCALKPPDGNGTPDAGDQTVVCESGLTACSGACADLETDASHCGDCGNACSPGEPCASGRCAPPLMEWSQWPPPADAPAAGGYTTTAELVTDTATGLVWQRAASASKMGWLSAKTLCQELTLGGTSDWRLPTIIELGSIVNYGKLAPAIDTAVFPGTPSADFWSATGSMFDPSGSSPGAYAWQVNFQFGTTHDAEKSGSLGGGGHVRCVR